MTIAVMLLAYAVVMGAAGTWWLSRASWPPRAPRLGIAIWQALSLTVAVSPVLAGLILAVPCLQSAPPPGRSHCGSA